MARIKMTFAIGECPIGESLIGEIRVSRLIIHNHCEPIRMVNVPHLVLKSFERTWVNMLDEMIAHKVQ
jgi:hypothetical protein